MMGAAVVGALALVRRRETGVLLFIGTALGVYLVMQPRLSPYTDAKLMAVLSPAIVLTAAVGLALIARIRWWTAVPAGLCAAALLGGILWSDAETYHGTQIAPVEKMLAMEDVAEHYSDSKDLLLVHESEEFAKYFMRDAPINDHFEPITIQHIELTGGQGFRGMYFDLDAVVPEYLQEWRLIVLRKSPAVSRPPANYEQEYENEYYTVWRRSGEPREVQHFPIGSTVRASDNPDCGDLEDFVNRAGTNGEVVAAVPPEVVQFVARDDPDRSIGWYDHPLLEYAVVPTTPGEASDELDFGGGTYEAWLQGSFGRDMHVSVDGSEIGSVSGVQPPGQWHYVSTVELDPGEHEIRIERPGGNLEPGDGYRGAVGPLAFRATSPDEQLVPMTQADAPRLCRRQLDWVEAFDAR